MLCALTHINQEASGALSAVDRAWADPARWRGALAIQAGCEELLRSMSDALRHCGVSLNVESVRRPRDDRSTGYTLRINGELLDLFDYDPANPGMPLAAGPWMDCTVKPLGLVNRLLDEAGSSDRVAVFCSGGNDGLAVLLPLEAIQVLAESKLIPEHDWPVVPSGVT